MAAKKGSPAGQTNAAKDLWHNAVSMEGKEGARKERGRLDESGHIF